MNNISFGEVTTRLNEFKLILQGIGEVGKVIFSFAKITGLINQEENVYSLGEKAIIAEKNGLNLSDYSSYAEFYLELSLYEVEDKDNGFISDDMKLMKGVEIAVCLLIEKYLKEPIEKFIEIIVEFPNFFSKEMMEGLKELIERDSDFIKEFVTFVDGTEKNEVILQTTMDCLIRIFTDSSIKMNEKDALKEVLALRR